MLLRVMTAAAVALGALLGFAGPLIALGVVAGLAAALLALSHLEVGLWATIAIITLLPFGGVPFKIVFTPTFLDLAMGAVVLVYALEWMTGRRRRLTLTPAHGPIAIFLALMLFSFTAGLPNCPLTPNLLRQFAEMLLSILFAVILVALAARASALVALALAPSKGIDTSGWRSSEGLQAWWSALWHVTLASLGYGTAGAVLAIAFRSPVIALAAGVAWMLPGEAILTAAWSDGASWLPRQLLDALAKDGTASASFARAVALLAVYGAVAVAVAATLFARRDVTA